MPKDLTPFGIEHGGGQKNLKGQWNRASLDSGWKTAKKTLRKFNYDRMIYNWGFADKKPTISSSYNKVISRQYPKYTGPKPPNTNPRGGGIRGAHIRVQGHPMRAAGKFSTIPEGYLVNLSNQKHLAARTARVAKGVRVAKSFTPAGLALEGVIGAYKGYKRATGPGGTKFHSGKAGSHYLDLSTNKPGKYGVDY